MVRVRTLVNGFFAGYGPVSVGTIIEMDPDDARVGVQLGMVELVND